MVTTIPQMLIAIFIFCLILFLYLHIQFHLKTSDDLEIFEVDQASKDTLEEICDLRQPVLFDCTEELDKIAQNTNKKTLADNYPVFEIKIRESAPTPTFGVPLPLNVATRLFKQDQASVYFSEGNADFLSETGAVKHFSYNDDFLRPTLVSNCYYDVMFASNETHTPLRYDLNYRNYFMVTQGSIKIKLTPPKSSRYLYPVSDYETFEFYSPINPWSPQARYKGDFDKVKCLEITLTPGKLFFIPAFWWYSFLFSPDTSVSCLKYRTYMNNVAISPNIAMYGLQNQNIKRNFAKIVDSSVEEQTTNVAELPVDSEPTTETLIEPMLSAAVD